MEGFYGDKSETLFIAPNCGLDIKLDPTEYSKEFGFEYKVKKLEDFPLIKNHPTDVKGWLSPTRPVTLPEDAKKKAGIPVKAKWFAYIYPPRGLAKYIDWDSVSHNATTRSFSNSTVATWALPYLTSFGGFVYFDDEFTQLRVNAISFNETPYKLNFAGPFVATKDSYREITGLNRYQSLYLDAFREVDYIGSAWIVPEDYSFIDTEVEGQSQSHVRNHHGGFLYFQHDQTAVLFLVEYVFEMQTPKHGVGAPIIDAFRLCKHELKTTSKLSVTCPLNEQAHDMRIHHAAQEGSKEHMRHYIRNSPGSKSNLQGNKNLFLVQDSFGWTPLHYACCYHAKDHELIKMIVDHCPQAVNKTNKNDLYPIHLACHHNTSVEVIEVLLQNDSTDETLKQKSKHHGFLPLHFACSNNQTPIEVIRFLVLQDSNTVSAEGTIGSTALHMAIASNHNHKVIDIVLRHGSGSQASSMDKTNPILLETVNGMLPIHLACLKGCSVDIVSLLLEADKEDKCFYSNVKKCTEYDLMNSTILHIALAHSPTDVIKLLLMKEVKARCVKGGFPKNLLATAQNSRGETFPIHVACARKDLGVEIIKTLLRLERASISYIDGKGNTPLHHVCNNEGVDENLVELLLKTENDYIIQEGKSGEKNKRAVQMSNKEKETPLQVAVKSKAAGAHALLRPEHIYLKGMGSEAKDELYELVLENEIVQKNLVYNLAQRPYFALITLELVANIVATIIYFRASINTVNGVRGSRAIESGVLMVCVIVFILRELCQLITISPSDYISDAWNWIECASILALLTATSHMIQLRESMNGEHGEHGSSETRILFMFSGVLLLLQFIFIVRTTFLPFARFVAGLLAILFSLIPFLVVSVMLLLIFTYSYVISGSRVEECPNFGSCLLWTLEGFFYGMDGFAVNPVIDVLFGLIAVVILLNVVIAIVSNAWDDSVEDTREVFWQSRVEVLFQYSFFYNLFCADSAVFESFDQYGNQTENNTGKKKPLWKLLFSLIVNVIWFIFGLLTLGLLWPRELRRGILWYGIEKK